MLELLVIIESAILVFAVPAILLYGKERLKNLAREATDRALADHRHAQEQALAAIRADHERRVQEFGLYAHRQHAVYAELYKRVRDASDWFAGTYGLLMMPDFSEYNATELRSYLKRNHVLESRTQEVLAAAERGDSTAVGRLMSDLHLRLQRTRAERAFNRMKDYEAQNELYLSDEVRGRIHDVRHALARFAAALRQEERGGRVDTGALEKRGEMQSTVGRLYTTMRDELRRGDTHRHFSKPSE